MVAILAAPHRAAPACRPAVRRALGAAAHRGERRTRRAGQRGRARYPITRIPAPVVRFFPAPLGYAVVLGLVVLVLVALVALARVVAARREALRHWADARLCRLADAPVVGCWEAAHPRARALLVARLSPSGYLGLHLTIGLLLSAAALALCGGLAEDVLGREELAVFDLRLARSLHAHASRAGVTAFTAITHLGSMATLSVLAAVVGMLLLVRRRWLLAVGWIAATAAFAREMSWSSPSGHALGSFIGYGMLSYLLVLMLRTRRARGLTIAAAVLLVLAIGISQLYLGVHYFADVIGGFAAGAVWLSVCISSVEAVQRRRSLAVRVSDVRRPVGGTQVALAVVVALSGAAAPAPAQPPGAAAARPLAGLPVRADTAKADTGLAARVFGAIRQTNPELAARQAAVNAVEARRRATGFGPSAVLAAETEDVPNGGDFARAGSARVTIERAFLTGGRREAARALADVDIEASRAALLAANQRVTILATQALTRAVGWSGIAGRLAGTDSLLGAAEDALRVRFTTGGARYVDVLRLRTERLRLASERAAALTEVQVARRALAALVAPQDSMLARVVAATDSLVAIGAHGPVLPAPNVDSLLQTSGALRLAEVGVLRAQAAQRLALAERRPVVTGLVGVQRFAGNLTNGYTIGPVVGGSISLPFTARRATNAGIAAAAREVTAAQAGRRASVLVLRAQLLAARDRYEAARARLALYDAALLRGAREERESALASYRAGTVTLIELLDFERALARAEIDRLRSRIDAADALAELLTAGTGGGALSPSLAPLSAGASAAATSAP